MTPAAAPKVAEERAAFEAYVSGPSGLLGGYTLARNEKKGIYLAHPVEAAWRAWQASSARLSALVAATREECAKVCDKRASVWSLCSANCSGDGHKHAAEQDQQRSLEATACGTAIRARGAS